MVLPALIQSKKNQHKRLAVLIDPDRTYGDALTNAAMQCAEHKVDYIFVGGSLLASHTTYECITCIKAAIGSSIPVVLFPGSSIRLAANADAMLFLSLISGRNAEYLIGKHVETAMSIKKTNVEVIPTGYILIDGGKPTSVSYLSNTQPIPADKPELAVSTAMAGELLGMKLIYLENGSGAVTHAGIEMINSVTKHISIPVIVGGGIKTPEQLQSVLNAGADIAVIGTALENDINILKSMVSIKDKING